MQIHVCGQRGVWATVEAPDGEILELRETLRDLEDNTQAIRFQVGGVCPSNGYGAESEPCDESSEPVVDGEDPKPKRKPKAT